MIFETLASVKFSDIKQKCKDKDIKKLSDALELEAAGCIKWKANSKKSSYTYPDGSQLTIRLDGYCYVHTGWFNNNGKFYYISDDDMKEPCLNIGFKA